MGLKHLVFVLLFYISAGIFVSLGVVKTKAVGHGYFVFHGLGAAGLAVISFFLLERGSLGLIFKLFFAFYVFFSLAYLLFIGRPAFKIGFYLLAVLSCLVVIGSDVLAHHPNGSQVFPSALYFLSNAIFSCLLLGFTLAAMLLGHWYLVDPKLSIDELKRVTLFLCGLILFRFFLGTSLCLPLFSGKSEFEIYTYLLSETPGIFLLMRWTWGLFLPLILGYLAWNTVKIRSTQSATGILYVTVVCVLTGEIMSQYLALYHGMPL